MPMVEEMTEIFLKPLDWDTERLGVKCGLIDATGLGMSYDSEKLTDEVKRLVREEEEAEFITIKLPWSCVKTVNSVVGLGGVLVDAELTFQYDGSFSRRSEPASDSFSFNFCEKVESKPLIPLAEGMRLSRFFVDPRIPDNRALHLWEESIKNHCEGFADKLMVACHKGEPCGIVTLYFKGPGRIFLHMVGVLKEYQGRRVGRMMLEKVVNRYGGNYTINVETQSTNLAAQALYQKSGFRYSSLKYVLHLWRQKFDSGNF